MNTLCFAALSLSVLGAVFQPPAEVHSVELTEWRADHGGNGHFYEAVEAPAGITWDDAEAYATARGGYLATITSAPENMFVFKLVDDAGFWVDGPNGDSLGPWLGGTKTPASTLPGEGWEWGHGEGPFAYTNWSKIQPGQKAPHEIHLGFHTEKKGEHSPEWVGLGPGTQLHGFVAEYDANPLPQSLGYVALFAVCFTGLVVISCGFYLLFRKRPDENSEPRPSD